jgi:hypothetical protein
VDIARRGSVVELARSKKLLFVFDVFSYIWIIGNIVAKKTISSELQIAMGPNGAKLRAARAAQFLPLIADNTASPQHESSGQISLRNFKCLPN